MWKLLFVSILAATLGGCQKSPSQGEEQDSAQPRQKITVAYTTRPQSALVHIAVAKGYFAAEGLDVRPSLHDYGKTALQAVLDKQADFATVAETPVMFSVLKGEKIFVVASIETSSMNNAIVARTDAGIAKPGDLKGKRVGFTPGTTSDFFLDSLLTANGLTRMQIMPVAMPPDDMQQAIMTRQVDALSAWNYPLTQIRRQLGAGGVVFFDREIYTEIFNVVAQQDFVRNNPEAARHLLRALLKAERFVASNPDEAQGIMSVATKADRSLVRDVWDAFHYQVVLDQTLLITLEDETRWAMKNRLTDKTEMPNYMDYIHLDSLRTVKPDAVRLNR